MQVDAQVGQLQVHLGVGAVGDDDVFDALALTQDADAGLAIVLLRRHDHELVYTRVAVAGLVRVLGHAGGAGGLGNLAVDNVQVVPVRGDVVGTGVALRGAVVAGLRDAGAVVGGGVLVRVVEVAELVQVVHHGLVLGHVGMVRLLHLRCAGVGQAQVVAELVEDGVAHLLLGRHQVVLGHVERAIGDQAVAGGQVAHLLLVADDAHTEDGLARTEQVLTVLDQAHTGDLRATLVVLEVDRRVRQRVAALGLFQPRNVAVVVAGVDVEVVATAVKQVHQVVEDLARRTVDVDVRVRTLQELAEVVLSSGVLALLRAALGLPLGLHPVQLEEKVLLLRVRAPAVQWELVAVWVGVAVDLPFVGQAVAVGILQCLVGVAGDGHARAQRFVVALPHAREVAVAVVRACFCGLLAFAGADGNCALERGVQLVAAANVDGVLVRLGFNGFGGDREVVGHQPVREHELQVPLAVASQLHPHVHFLRGDGEGAHELHAELRVGVGEGDNVAFVVGGGLNRGVLARELDLLAVRVGIQVERRGHQAGGEAVVHQPGHAALVHVNVLEALARTGCHANLVALGQVHSCVGCNRQRDTGGEAECDCSRDCFLTSVHHSPTSTALKSVENYLGYRTKPCQLPPTIQAPRAPTPRARPSRSHFRFATTLRPPRRPPPQPP